MNPVRAQVLENVEVADGIRRLKLRPEQTPADVRPGRFFMLGVGSGHDPLLRRPLSYLSFTDGDEQNIEFLYQVKGRGTRALSRIGPDRSIDFIGPLGSGWDLDGLPQRVIMAAGGLGIVPLYAAADTLRRAEPKPRVEFIQGARDAGGLLLAEDIEATGALLSVCTDDGSAGEKGLVTDLLERSIKAGSDKPAILSCGPKPMLKRVAQIARDNGLSCQVGLEARMGCGMGACLSCVVSGSGGRNLRVCKEGPVFDAGEIDWEAENDGV